MAISYESFIKNYIENNRYKATLKSCCPNWMKVLSMSVITMIVYSMSIVFNPYLLLLIVPQLFIIFAKIGVEIKLDTRLVRHGVKIGNFQFGKWRKMPKILFIEIFSNKSSQRGSWLKRWKWTPNWLVKPMYYVTMTFDDNSGLTVLAENNLDVINLVTNELVTYFGACVIDSDLDPVPSLFVR